MQQPQPQLSFRMEGAAVDCIFRDGYQFQPMTYDALCETVAFESCRQGGPPLRPKRSLDSAGIIDYVTFYCPHGRKHQDQAVSSADADAKSRRNKRASRANEDRRILFCGCNFSFRVRRDPKVAPVQIVESGIDQREKEGAEGDSESGDDRPKPSAIKANSSIVYGWFVDSHKRQEEDHRYRKNYHCWDHSGHIRRSQPISDVTPVIRNLIAEHAKHNISIASISSMIFHKHKVFLSDTQIRWELTKLDISVTGGRIDMAVKGPMSSAQNFVSCLLAEPDVTAAFLFENLTTSDEAHVKYDTFLNSKLEVSGDMSVGSDVSRGRPSVTSDVTDSERAIHGRVYDTHRIVSIPGCTDELFLVGVCWVHRDELRCFSHYPEVLVVDSKANTNKFKKAFFSGVGVDGSWKNITLFRSWIPNQTEASYAWLMTTALPLLVSADIRCGIEMIMSDADATMGSVITECCKFR